jgi:hypothetical protein
MCLCFRQVIRKSEKGAIFFLTLHRLFALIALSSSWGSWKKEALVIFTLFFTGFFCFYVVGFWGVVGKTYC